MLDLSRNSDLDSNASRPLKDFLLGTDIHGYLFRSKTIHYYRYPLGNVSHVHAFEDRREKNLPRSFGGKRDMNEWNGCFESLER